MVKRRWKQMLAMLLSAGMVWSMSGLMAFASDDPVPPADDPPGTEVELTPPSGPSSDPERDSSGEAEKKPCTCDPKVEGETGHTDPECPFYPKDEVPTESEEAKALIETLPSLEEFHQWKPNLEIGEEEDEEEAYDAAVAAYRTQVEEQVKAARAAYDAMSKEQKDAFAPEQFQKLTTWETKLSQPVTAMESRLSGLPSLEEFQSWEPALTISEADSGYQAAYDAAVAAHRAEVEEQVQVVREAYDALNDAQRAVLDPALVEKLTAWEGILVPVMRAPKAEGTGTKDAPLEVPQEALVIDGGIYYGISKTWFATANPEKGTVYVALSIPSSVTTICKDGFNNAALPERVSHNVVTSQDEETLGVCRVASIDFSDATGLTTIRDQAALNGSDLTGVLDLSKTKIETLGKSAFNGCTGLTGVILPSTLKVLGAEDGSGSVFKGCTGLQFVRTAGGDPDAVFQLPDGLEVIGKDTFYNTFPAGKNVIARIPASVTTIGSQAFYSNGAFLQIFIERSEDYGGYNTGAFKATGNEKSLLIFPNSTSYNAVGTFTRIEKTYPVSIQFMMGDGSVQEQTKLYGQSIRYEQTADGVWVENEGYTLPQTPEIAEKPGYRAGWQIEGSKKTLTTNGIVDGAKKDVLQITVSNQTDIPVFTDPIVKPTVNGQVLEAEGNEAGFVYFDLKVPEHQIGSANAPTIGVQVEHPLAGEGDGEYKVYFEYRWRDVIHHGAPAGESGIMEGQTGPELEITDPDMLRYHVSEDDPEEDSKDYYIVEIYGYYQPVEARAGSKGTLFYKSWHGQIGVSDINTVQTTYRLTVQADNTITQPTPGPDEPGSGGSGRPGSGGGSGGSSTYDPQAKDPDRAQVSLEARKLLDGKTPGRQAFTFTLTDESGKVVRTAKNEGGKIVFDSLALLPGTYRYTMKEVDGSAGSAFGYDDTVYEAEIFVYTSGGKYTAMVSYYQDGKELDGLPTFRNTTAPAAPGTNKENPNTGGGPAFPAALTAAVSLGAVALLWRKRS